MHRERSLRNQTRLGTAFSFCFAPVTGGEPAELLPADLALVADACGGVGALLEQAAHFMEKTVGTPAGWGGGSGDSELKAA